MVSLYGKDGEIKNRGWHKMIEVVNERRRFPRHNVRLPVQYKNMKALSDSSNGALIKDISEGGVRFLGNQFLSLANRLLLSISLPAPSHAIKVISKVAWVRKIPMGDQYEIGNHFLSLSESDKKALKNYLEKAQPESGK